MNKLILTLSFGFLLVACQNTPTNNTDSSADSNTSSTVASGSAAATPQEVEQLSTVLTNASKSVTDIRSEVDNLPAAIKKEKSAEIEGMYSTLEGILEKQTMMLQEVSVVANAASASKEGAQSSDAASTLNTAQLKDYLESAARYEEELKAIQETVKQWTGKKEQ